jgi:hypothetical protein
MRGIADITFFSPCRQWQGPKDKIMFYFRARALSGALIFITATAWAQINVEPAGIDLGRQKPEVYATAQVLLTNTSPHSVALLGTSADCGCTVATMEAKTLPPGGSTSLGIAVETSRAQGLMQRTVWVQTSAGQITIPIKLNVVPYDHWVITPATVVLPKAESGKPCTTTATLKHTTGAKVALGKITCDPAWIDAAAATEDGQTFTLTLVTREGAPCGGQPIKVDVETTDGAEPHVRFSVFPSNPFAESEARARNAAARKVAPGTTPEPEHP